MKNDDKPSQYLTGKRHTNQAFRDYDVHMLIEDEGSDYLLRIGTVFERANAELSGETAYGRLILRAHHQPIKSDRQRDLQIKDVHHVAPPMDDWRPNA